MLAKPTCCVNGVARWSFAAAICLAIGLSYGYSDAYLACGRVVNGAVGGVRGNSGLVARGTVVGVVGAVVLGVVVVGAVVLGVAPPVGVVADGAIPE